MPITSIVRAKSGDAQREVPLAEITIPDIRAFPLFLSDDRWIGAVARYHEDLANLLAILRADLGLPDEFFVPDLWGASTKLPTQESELLRDAWSLGHELAAAAGYSRATVTMPFTRNGVGGSLYSR
jgi:hypothetical protein